MRRLIVLTVLYYLRFLARFSLRMSKSQIIGVAGSAGKSSAKNAIFAVLSDKFRVRKVNGNSETGVPLGILEINPGSYSFFDWLRMVILAPFGINNLIGTKFLILEMGTDDPAPPKNMDYLLTIAKPDYGVFLNVYPTHTFQFERALTGVEKRLPYNLRLKRILEIIADEDGKIITKAKPKIGIYNLNNKYTRNAVDKFFKLEDGGATKLLGFGRDKKSDLKFQGYDVSLEGSVFSYKIKESGQTLKIDTQLLLPDVYWETFAPAVIIGKELGLTNDYISETLKKNFVLPKGRSSLFEGKKGSLIIDSSYNASRFSIEAFLRLTESLKIKTGRPVVFLFGDMRELGEESKFEHEAVAKRMVGVVDLLYCVGPLTKSFVIPIFSRRAGAMAKWFASSVQAGENLALEMPDDAIIVVKGSQNGIFLEEGVKKLLKDREDESCLCRQEPAWLDRKRLFFSNNIGT